MNGKNLIEKHVKKNWFIKTFKNYYYLNKNSVSIEFKDNKKIIFNINEINLVNFEIRDIKIKIIKYFLKFLNLNESFKNHLINFLFLKDAEIHRKACLIKFLLDHKYKVKKIQSSFLSKDDQLLLKEFDINVEKVFSKRIKILPIMMFYAIYRRKLRYTKVIKLFPAKKSSYKTEIKYSRILRCWVDLAENIYLNRLKQSLENTIIHINPGYLGFFPSKRQEKYLEHLKINNRNYFFYIPKINYYKLIKIAIRNYFSLIPKKLKIPFLHVIIARLEIDDYIEYLTKEFPDVKEFYTKEEFLPSTTYLTELLKKRNIKVINFAHGLGVYCPIVNYDEFYVFSKVQKDYYISSSTNFRYFETEISPIRQKKDITQDFAIVFIAQSILSSINSITIKAAYKKTVEFIESLVRDLNIPIFVKYHPNSKEVDKIFSDKIKIIEKISDLPSNYNFLSITLYSTYVFELLNRMPFLIINPKNKVNLKYYFPDENNIFANSYKDLKDKLKRFLTEPNYYYEYSDYLFLLMKEISE